MKRDTCFTCALWRAGASSNTKLAVPDDSAKDVGVCENIAPQVFITDQGPATLQPTMHATRFCAEWIADDDDPDPGGGEEMPADNIHRLPVQPTPIAA